MIVVLARNKPGTEISKLKTVKGKLVEVSGPWKLNFNHCRGIKYNPLILNVLQDISKLEEYKYFSGEIIYSTTLDLKSETPVFMELKGVHDIAALKINGINCGLKWYGDRIYDISNAIKTGRNNIEITVTSLMGNYMKSLVDNPNAQYWTNEKRKNQEITPMGIDGPVVLMK